MSCLFLVGTPLAKIQRGETLQSSISLSISSTTCQAAPFSDRGCRRQVLGIGCFSTDRCLEWTRSSFSVHQHLFHQPYFDKQYFRPWKEPLTRDHTLKGGIWHSQIQVFGKSDSWGQSLGIPSQVGYWELVKFDPSTNRNGLSSVLRGVTPALLQLPFQIQLGRKQGKTHFSRQHLRKISDKQMATTGVR